MIPSEYLNMNEVFSKAKASRLPPHRSYDCAIGLLTRTTPPHNQIYLWSVAEQQMIGKRSASTRVHPPVHLSHFSWVLLRGEERGQPQTLH